MKKPTPSTTKTTSTAQPEKKNLTAAPRRPACWNSRDNWGSCCSTCPYWGEAYKPCSVCSEYFE